MHLHLLSSWNLRLHWTELASPSHSPWQPPPCFLSLSICLLCKPNKQRKCNKFLWLFYFTEHHVFKVHPGCSMCLNFPPFKIIFKKELSSFFKCVIICGMYRQNLSSVIFLSSTLWLLWWEQPGREWPRPVPLRCVSLEGMPCALSAWRGSPALCPLVPISISNSGDSEALRSHAQSEPPTHSHWSYIKGQGQAGGSL